MRKLLAAAVGTALTLIAGAALTVPQTARAATVEPTSWGKSNLISYADSDFESGVGTWVSYSNSTLSQDSTQAFHGQDSLKMVAGTPGSQAAKALGNGAQINVTAGDTYRVSTWVKAAASPGRRHVRGWLLQLVGEVAGLDVWQHGDAEQFRRLAIRL